jgi:hypothetical protein
MLLCRSWGTTSNGMQQKNDLIKTFEWAGDITYGVFLLNFLAILIYI